MNPRPTVALAMGPDTAALALPPALRERLSGSVELWDGVISDFVAVEPRLADLEVLLTSWQCPVVDEAFLDAAPKLQAIVHAAGSVKHLPPQVWERGIRVSSAAAANARPVAQYTVSAILLAGKGVFGLSHAYAQGEFAHPADIGNHAQVAGVIGASLVGRLVLPRLAAEGFRLLLHDPTLTPRQAAEICPQADVELVELDELLRRSDVVSVHAPALPETRHLLDERRLGLLRDGAVLVNTARGQLIDTEALVEHCVPGRISAVLDVTDPEPLPAGHPLFSLPNVLVTPHLAGALGNEISCLGAFAVAEIERIAAGRPLVGQVDFAELSHLA